VVYAVPMTIHRHADRVDPRAFTLPPPRPIPGTGGKIYTLALAIPGVFSYSWGDVYTSPEVLQDPAYHEALVGTPIIDDDGRPHLEGPTTETIQDLAIGRMIKAWWDDEQQALLAEAAIDVQRGLDAIDRGVVGVSAAYDGENLPEVGEVDGARYTYRQIRRVAPSNTAITLNPRQAVTRLQADALERIMEIPAEILKKMADADVPLLELVNMLMEAIKEGAANKAAADALRAKYEPEGMGDAAVEVEVTPSEEGEGATMDEVADTIRAADALGIEIGKVSHIELQRAIVVRSGVTQPQADALDAAGLAATLAVIKARPAVVTRSADAWDDVSKRTAPKPTSPGWS
jgi:hypothetical protein